MRTQQISVFLENKSGRLAAVTRVLGARGIDIRALSIADTADFGVLRFIVSDPEAAHAALRDEGFTVSLTDVLAVEVPDRPGGLSAALEILEGAGVDIEYLYAFCEKCGDNALVVLRVKEPEEAAALLERRGVRVLSSAQAYRL